MRQLDRALVLALRDAFLEKGVPTTIAPPVVLRNGTRFAPDLMIEHEGRPILIEISLDNETDIARRKQQLESYARGVPGSRAFLFASSDGDVVIAVLRPDGSWQEITGSGDADAASKSADQMLELIGA